MNNSPKNRDSNKIDSCPEKKINIKKSRSNTMINFTYNPEHKYLPLLMGSGCTFTYNPEHKYSMYVSILNQLRKKQ
jgi:hypothetical protein